MSEWTDAPLASLLKDSASISYGIVQPGSHQEAGVPVLRVADIRNGRINTLQPLRVSPEIEAAYARTRLKGSELLLTLVGTVGETAVVPDALVGWNVARAVAVIPVRDGNFVLGLDEGKKRWADVVLGTTKAFSLCGTLDEAAALREEIAFFQAIKAVIAKATTSEAKLSEERRHAVLKQILDNAVVSEGVDDIFKLAGLDRPDIGVLSDAFMEEVRQLPQKNLAVELLQKLLNDQVRSRMRTNVVLERKFSEHLQAALNRCQSRAVESAQVIEELIAMAKEFREEAQRGAALGLNESELAFYDALADNATAVEKMGDETLKAIAREVTEKLRNGTSVDWQKRESVRARLRNLLRITLRRYKYPLEGQDDAIRLVLEQAERLSEQWSG
jgi:type I restriction enzyme, R subunit